MPNRHNVHVTRSSGRTGMIAVSVVVLGAVLAGCTPVGVAVGAGAAGVTATQKEKGFSQSVDDTRIRAQLNADFIANNVDLFSQISFTVEEGRVLLAGNVPTPEARVEAVKLTWGVPGVTEVINEITVTDKSSLSDDSRDLWIGTKLRGRQGGANQIGGQLGRVVPQHCKPAQGFAGPIPPVIGLGRPAHEAGVAWIRRV